MPPVRVDRVELRAGGASAAAAWAENWRMKTARLPASAAMRADVRLWTASKALLEAACHWPPLWYLRFAWVRLRPPCRQSLP